MIFKKFSMLRFPRDYDFRQEEKKVYQNCLAEILSLTSMFFFVAAGSPRKEKISPKIYMSREAKNSQNVK